MEKNNLFFQCNGKITKKESVATQITLASFHPLQAKLKEFYDNGGELK